MLDPVWSETAKKVDCPNITSCYVGVEGSTNDDVVSRNANRRSEPVQVTARNIASLQHSDRPYFATLRSRWGSKPRAE